jgi:hypothetical protein
MRPRALPYIPSAGAVVMPTAKSEIMLVLSLRPEPSILGYKNVAAGALIVAGELLVARITIP